jgi:hypothetical protein
MLESIGRNNKERYVVGNEACNNPICNPSLTKGFSAFSPTPEWSVHQEFYDEVHRIFEKHKHDFQYGNRSISFVNGP